MGFGQMPLSERLLKDEMARASGIRHVLNRLTGRAAGRLVRIVGATSTLVLDPPDAHARLRAQQPAILAFWHGQFMMVANQMPSDMKGSAMVGRHADAEIIGAVVSSPNVGLVRGAGAGNRPGNYGGARALRAALKTLASNQSIGMTADVFPEPPRRAGKGIVTLARLSGRPIVPLAIATSRYLSFNTWSRMTINLPFSRLAFSVGEPIYVPRDAGPQELEAKRQEVEAALNSLTRRAYDLAGADMGRAMPALTTNGADRYERKFKPAHANPALATQTEEALNLFGDCLAFEASTADTMALRGRLFSDPVAWAALFNIAVENRLEGALAQRLVERSLVPPMPRTETRDEEHPAQIVAAQSEANRALRADLKIQLASASKILNQHGVEPLLLKGAQLLWKDESPWRTLVDLDLLVPKASAAHVHHALIREGYRRQNWFVERGWSHHLPPLALDTADGLLEIHWQATNRYGEGLLPTAELWRESRRDEQGEARVRVLSDELNLLHSLLHHHIGHRGDVRAVINLKGLYEFADAFTRLSETSLANLASRAQRHIRVMTALDLWIAAAHDLFRIPVRAPFAVQDDAMQIWRRMKERGNLQEKHKKYPGLRDTLSLASNAGRLGKAGFGPSQFGRYRARAAIMSSVLIPKFFAGKAPRIP